VPGQALPSLFRANPDLRHRHPEELLTAGGLDDVLDKCPQHGDVVDDDHLGLTQYPTSPDSRSARVGLDVGSPVEGLAGMRGLPELGVQQVTKPIRITICSCLSSGSHGSQHLLLRVRPGSLPVTARIGALCRTG